MYVKRFFMLLPLLLVLLQPGFSEKSYQITETELNQIQEETSRLLQTVNEQTSSIKKLETERNELLTLSNQLKAENQKLKADVKTWKIVSLSIGAGVLAGAVILYTAK